MDKVTGDEIKEQGKENFVDYKGRKLKVIEPKSAKETVKFITDVDKEARETLVKRHSREGGKVVKIDGWVSEISKGQRRVEKDKMFGNRTFATEWVADFTEHMYAKEFQEISSRSGYNAYGSKEIVRKKDDVNEAVNIKDEIYFDKGTGQPYDEIEWIKVADVFVPKLLAAVDVKTTITFDARPGEALRQAGKMYMGTQFGGNVTNTKGLQAYTRFIISGRTYLATEKYASVKHVKRLFSDYETAKSFLKITSPAMAMEVFEHIKENLVIDYWIEGSEFKIANVSALQKAVNQIQIALGLRIAEKAKIIEAQNYMQRNVSNFDKDIAVMVASVLKDLEEQQNMKLPVTLSKKPTDIRAFIGSQTNLKLENSTDIFLGGKETKYGDVFSKIQYWTLRYLEDSGVSTSGIRFSLDASIGRVAFSGETLNMFFS